MLAANAAADVAEVASMEAEARVQATARRFSIENRSPYVRRLW